MKDRRFIYTFFMVFITILLLIGLANYLVDPYGAHFQYRYTGFNKYKPTFLKFTRTIKLFNADAVEPDAIFLGNSRLLYLVPEEAFGLYKHQTYYNFSLSSGSPTEMNEYLAYSIRNFTLDHVYYGIDYIAMCSWGKRYGSGFDPKLVSGEKSMFLEFIKMHTSSQAIEKTYECVKSNITDPEGLQVKYHYNCYGSRTNRWRELNYKKKGGDEWIDKEIGSVLHTYRSIYSDSSLSIPSYNKEAYCSILKQCEDNGIGFTAFINPLYKDQFSMLIRSAAYPSYIHFLRFLAENGGIWYFGGINSITSDKNYYWDSQHPRKALGPLIAGSILGDPPPNYPNNLFGNFYDNNNIDILIAEIDSARSKLLGTRSRMEIDEGRR